METSYKPSMFNRVVQKNGEMLLYNSVTGLSGITYVPVEFQDDVKKCLESSESSCNDEVYQQLARYGFLVSEDCDEKRKREYLISNRMNSSTLQMVIHVTSGCNFRCRYCYMDFSEPRMISEEAQKGIVNYIRKNIMQYTAVAISWFGGEPLMGIDIIQKMSNEIMEICNKTKRTYMAGITTNGYLLTEKNLKVLSQVKVNNITVTIDGTEKLHDSYRVLKDGSPTFRKIIENLKMLKEKDNRRELTVVLRSNLTKKHLDFLGEYYNYFDELFGDDKRFSLFVRPVGDYGGERIKSMEDDLIAFNNMGFVYDYFANNQRNLKFNTNFEDLQFGGDSCNSRLYNKFTIGCDGSVHKCDEDTDYPLGRLSKEGVMYIDEVQYTNWVIAPKNSKCDDCFYSCVCLMDGCPKMRIRNNAIGCSRDFKELDSLVWLLYKSQNVNRLFEN